MCSLRNSKRRHLQAAGHYRSCQLRNRRPLQGERASVYESCWQPSHEFEQVARCDTAFSCSIGNKADGTTCAPLPGTTAAAQLANSSCSTVCSRGFCVPSCPEPVGEPLPPLAMPPCALTDCTASSSGVAVCATDVPAISVGANNAPTCECNCRLPLITQPSVCNAASFAACVNALPICPKVVSCACGANSTYI